MRKKIKRYGSSTIILLSPGDLEMYGLKQGDIVDITITKIEGEKDED